MLKHHPAALLRLMLRTQRNHRQTESEASFPARLQQLEERKHLSHSLGRRLTKQLPMSLLSKPLGTYSQPPASCSRFYVGSSAPESPVLQGTFTASETDVHGAWGAAVLATASHPRRVGCVFLSQKKKDPL